MIWSENAIQVWDSTNYVYTTDGVWNDTYEFSMGSRSLQSRMYCTTQMTSKNKVKLIFPNTISIRIYQLI